MKKVIRKVLCLISAAAVAVSCLSVGSYAYELNFHTLCGDGNVLLDGETYWNPTKTTSSKLLTATTLTDGIVDGGSGADHQKNWQATERGQYVYILLKEPSSLTTLHIYTELYNGVFEISYLTGSESIIDDYDATTYLQSEINKNATDAANVAERKRMVEIMTELDGKNFVAVEDATKSVSADYYEASSDSEGFTVYNFGKIDNVVALKIGNGVLTGKPNYFNRIREIAGYCSEDTDLPVTIETTDCLKITKEGSTDFGYMVELRASDAGKKLSVSYTLTDGTDEKNFTDYITNAYPVVKMNDTVYTADFVNSSRPGDYIAVVIFTNIPSNVEVTNISFTLE